MSNIFNINPYEEDEDTPEMREMLNNIRQEEHRDEIKDLTVNIVDAVCGAGKTSAAINMINNSDDDTKFLYITPYLNEVERIIKSCPKKKFKQPDVMGSKLKGIQWLFNQGMNIVSTHSLFLQFNEDIMELVRIQGYVLIMDEVVEVVKQMDDIKGADLKYLLNYTITGENGILKWNNQKKYDGEWLDKYRGYIDLEALYYYNNTALLYLFPVKCFTAFKDIYILTYMFDSQIQRCYYDYNNLKYKYLGIKGDSLETYNFSDNVEDTKKIDYGKLIHIVQNKKLNDIGDRDTALSVSWYNKNKDGILIEELKKRTSNFFKNIAKTPSSKNLWTTFEKNKTLLKNKGYSKSFLACNARATNEYMDRVSVAYLCNRYFNPILKGFFLDQHIRVDENGWALSELLQFIFRSAIRNEEEINIYIPSFRMRTLLEEWIEKGDKASYPPPEHR